MHIGLIMIAAGYGSFRRDESGAPISKLIEDVGSQPMILRSLSQAVSAGIMDVVVVVNPLFGPRIEHVIRTWIGKRPIRVRFVTQPDRMGAADAAFRAIPAARSMRLTRALVTYGDMPLWSAQTIRMLVRSDLICAQQGEKSVVTMVTVQRMPDFPILDRYGRIIRDHAGTIDRIVEVNDCAARESDLQSSWVNPSLWVWDLAWLERHIPMVMPKRREVGSPERYMPPLVAIAHREGGHIEECPLDVARTHEALGANTLEELAIIQSYLGEELLAL